MLTQLFDLLPEIPTLIRDKIWHFQRVKEDQFEFDRLWRDLEDGRRLHLHSMQKNDETEPFWHVHETPLAVLSLGDGPYDAFFGIGSVATNRITVRSVFAYEMPQQAAHAVRTLGPTTTIYLVGTKEDGFDFGPREVPVFDYAQLKQQIDEAFLARS